MSVDSARSVPVESAESDAPLECARDERVTEAAPGSRTAGGAPTSQNAPAVRWATWLNLVLPGGGLVLVGAWASGVLGWLLWAVSLNLAIASTLLFPDDFAPRARALIIGVAAASYVAAQLRMAQAARRLRYEAALAERRAVLQGAGARREDGDAAGAVALLQSLAQEFPRDLLVLYRLAEALGAAGDVHGAADAQRRLRAVDRHGIYRRPAR